MHIAQLFLTRIRPLLRRRPMLLGLLSGAALLAGCSPIRLLDGLTPAGTYALDRDRAYGEHPRQRLDVYRPVAGGGQTIVVFFYGGNWRAGAKADYRFVAESLTRHGVTVVIPDYRVYPEVTFPIFVEDGARVIRWVRDNLSGGAEAARVFVMGHSSGAHVAALLALDARYLQAVGLEQRALAGLIGIAGPYDFLPMTSPRTREVFAGAVDDPVTQPIRYVGRDSPPALLFHGTSDRTVYPRNSENLAAALRGSGVPARLVLYPERGHVEIMLGLSSALDGDGRLMTELLAFTAAP
jgi:acetyl esterase/lipase